MRLLDGITDSNGPEFEQFLGVCDGQGAWHVAVHGVSKSQTWLNE